MKKGGGSESTIIIGPSKSVLAFALHSLESVLGLARFRVFGTKLLLLFPHIKKEIRGQRSVQKPCFEGLNRSGKTNTNDGRTSKYSEYRYAKK